MSFTYVLSTDVGKVRLLIGDVDSTDASRQIYSDEEIDAFLELRGGSVHRASATALRAIASNEVQVLKVVRNLDLETDGAKVAETLRKLATDLEAEADALDDAAVDLADGGFEIAEWLETPSQRHESRFKTAMRTGGF